MRTKVAVVAFLLACLALHKRPEAQTFTDQVFEVQIVKSSPGRFACNVGAVKTTSGQAWLGAQHCVEEAGQTYTIGGEPATVIAQGNYLVAFKSPLQAAKPLALSPSDPRDGDPIKLLGGPYAIAPIATLLGSVAALLVNVGSADGSTTHRMSLFQVPNVGGMSGSPILNAKGQLVSVDQSMPCNFPGGSAMAFCPVLLGSYPADVRAFVRGLK